MGFHYLENSPIGKTSHPDETVHEITLFALIHFSKQQSSQQFSDVVKISKHVTALKHSLYAS